MCIISFHLKQHPAYKLILIANRDEFYGRPTAKAHYWEDAPFLLAGRDLQAMGTWMGITKTGRLAALTNYRDPKATIDQPKSRGKIVSNYLTSTIAPKNYLHSLKEEAHRYNGFNLLVGSVDDLYFYNKAENTIQSLKPGTYSVSNASLNTPWPKVIKAKHTLQNYCLNNNNIDPEILFEQLADRTLADEQNLPDTGIDIELEKRLSSIFIKTADYGTRSSSVLLVSRDNEVTFIERTFKHGVRVNEEDVHENFIIKG